MEFFQDFLQREGRFVSRFSAPPPPHSLAQSTERKFSVYVCMANQLARKDQGFPEGRIQSFSLSSSCSIPLRLQKNTSHALKFATVRVWKRSVKG